MYNTYFFSLLVLTEIFLSFVLHIEFYEKVPILCLDLLDYILISLALN